MAQHHASPEPHATVTGRDLERVILQAVRGVRVRPSFYAGLIPPHVTRIRDSVVELSNGQEFRLELAEAHQEARQEVEHVRAI